MDHALAFVGVTGTNGKTTTTSLIASIVAAAGQVAARVTTLGSWVGERQVSDTTETEAFTRCLELARDSGVRTFCVETTSKALAEGFARHYPVDVAVFTNFSRDHLDYHGSAEQYLAAKAQLFMALQEGGTAVLNAASEACTLIDEVTPKARARSWFSVHPTSTPTSLAATRVEVDRGGTLVTLAPSPLADALGGALRLSLLGEPFAEDALAAALAAHALGYSAQAIRQGLESFGGVPGRFQRVCGAPLVVVDYAHTPDALDKSLRLSRRLAGTGWVWVVFGCGGERDPGKRPEMGRIAGELADRVILTNDNPRSEDPGCILQEIALGCLAASAREEAPASLGRISEQQPTVFCRVPDRDEAIATAIRALTSERDVVLIAGKGHETLQWIGAEARPSCDVQLALRALDARDREQP